MDGKNPYLDLSMYFNPLFNPKNETVKIVFIVADVYFCKVNGDAFCQAKVTSEKDIFITQPSFNFTQEFEEKGLVNFISLGG